MGRIAFACLVVSLGLGPQDSKLDYPPIEEHSHKFQVTQKYERVRDYTALDVDLGVVFLGNPNVEMSLSKLFRGEGRNTPFDTVRIRFHSTSKEWNYLRFHAVAMLVDEERWAFDTEHDGDVETGFVEEHTYLSMSDSQLIKLANANAVEIKYGITPISLGRQHIRAIREFASYIGLPDAKIRDVNAPPKLEIPTPPKRQRFLLNEQVNGVYPCVVATNYETFERIAAIRSTGQSLDQPIKNLLASGELAKVPSHSPIKILELKESYRLDVPKLIKFEILAGPRKGFIGWCLRDQMVVPLDAPPDPIEEAEKKRIATKAKQAEDKKLQARISQLMSLAKAVEKSNPKAAIEYYQEVLDLADPDFEAATRAKVLIESLRPKVKNP